VSGFLSVSKSSWDPSLALVMGGALALCIPGYRLIAARQSSRPVCAQNFGIPKPGAVDHGKLLVGGAMFGAGWGLAGLCPGPAVVSIVARPTAGLLVWLGAMIGGMFAHKRFGSRLEALFADSQKNVSQKNKSR